MHGDKRRTPLGTRPMSSKTSMQSRTRPGPSRPQIEAPGASGREARASRRPKCNKKGGFRSKRRGPAAEGWKQECPEHFGFYKTPPPRCMIPCSHAQSIAATEGSGLVMFVTWNDKRHGEPNDIASGGRSPPSLSCHLHCFCRNAVHAPDVHNAVRSHGANLHEPCLNKLLNVLLVHRIGLACAALRCSVARSTAHKASAEKRLWSRWPAG